MDKVVGCEELQRHLFGTFLSPFPSAGDFFLLGNSVIISQQLFYFQEEDRRKVDIRIANEVKQKDLPDEEVKERDEKDEIGKRNQHDDEHKRENMVSFTFIVVQSRCL